MIPGARIGWQTMLADLALILFMVTASTVSRQRETTEKAHLPPSTEPVAVYRPQAGTPPLAEWLAGQGHDERTRLTIVAHYTAGDPAASSAAAFKLAREAAASGIEPRLIIEPGEKPGLEAVLAFDRVETGTAIAQ